MSRFSIILRSLFVGALLATNGCSDQDSKQASAAANPRPQNLYAQFEQQARALAADAMTKASSNLLPNPDEASFIHPLEPLEFWVYLAILRDEQGQRYAVQQRFARLAIAPSTAEKRPTIGKSQWSYTHIVAIDAQFDHLTSGVKEVHTLAQRDALGLAGADKTEQRIWVGAFETKNRSTSLCRQSVALDSPQVSLRFGDLDLASAACSENDAPLLTQTAGFSVLRSAALPVAGSFVRDAQTVNLDGYGWIVQGWGVPPDSSTAAVVFDRAWLLMDNQLSMQLQRSRRASGRGARLTSGSAHNLSSSKLNDIAPFGNETVLADAEQKTSDNVPAFWQLNSQSHAMELKLTPMSTDRGPANFPGQSWFGVVAIDGSHRGYGFVDYSLR